MFRRPRFRPMRRVFQSVVPPKLRQAHELMSAGRSLEAAALFEELAYGAQARRLPQDAHLFIQAGRNYLICGQVDQAMQLIKQGLTILIERGRVDQSRVIGQMLIKDLMQANYPKEAEEIKNFISGRISFPDQENQGQIDSMSTSKLLPTHCQACGGMIRSDEMEWIDEVTAECPWCGSGVRSQ